MANIAKVPFTLFESFEISKSGVVRRRTLRYDLNALADFEQEVGMGFAQLMKSRAIFATTRAMLWAGLKHEDSSLTIERVGELLTQYMQLGGRVDEVLQTTFKAAMDQGALGKPEAAEAEDGEGNAESRPGPLFGMSSVPDA